MTQLIQPLLSFQAPQCPEAKYTAEQYESSKKGFVGKIVTWVRNPNSDGIIKTVFVALANFAIFVFGCFGLGNTYKTYHLYQSDMEEQEPYLIGAERIQFHFNNIRSAFGGEERLKAIPTVELNLEPIANTQPRSKVELKDEHFPYGHAIIQSKDLEGRVILGFRYLYQGKEGNQGKEGIMTVFQKYPSTYLLPGEDTFVEDGRMWLRIGNTFANSNQGDLENPNVIAALIRNLISGEWAYRLNPRT